MALKVLLLSLVMCPSLCGKILEYKLGVNFGQIFFDYSGNTRHAVNGESSSAITYDTKPTDRGAFFSNGAGDCIKLPPNDVAINNFFLTQKFSIVLWVMIGNSVPFMIFNRYSNDSQYVLKIKKDSNKQSISARFKYKDNSIDTFSSDYSFPSGDFYLGKWHLFIITLDDKELKWHLNGAIYSQNTLSLIYSEDNINFSANLGDCGGTTSSFEGYIWYFAIFDYIVTQEDFCGGYYEPGNCLVNACPFSCNPSIVQNNEQFCLSINFDSAQNGKEDPCSNDLSYGCSGSLSLNCDCDQKSCEVVDDKKNCLCISPEIVSATACFCPDKFYFLLNHCVSCNEECATCNKASICLTCIADHSTPDAIEGCKCNVGYYGSSLTTSDSCSACHQECKSCTEDFICLACIDQNAYPSESAGCFCYEGYYGTGLTSENACALCHIDCLTCENSNLCIKCKDFNAIASKLEGCDCPDGYYKDEFNRKCINCDKDCNQCNENQCFSCKDTYAEVIGLGCQCQIGYFNLSYDDSLNCVACQNTCLTCTNYNTCDECKIKYSNPNGNSCLCPENSFEKLEECMCLDGFFMESPLNIFYCSPCQNPCLTCISLTQCLSCKDQSLIADNNYNCVPDCEERFFVCDMMCEKCLELCKVCSNKESCDQCIDNAENINSACVCKKGYLYKDNLCIEDYFLAIISVSKLNKVSILFSEETENSLKSYSKNVSLSPAYPFTYKYFQINSTYFYLSLEFTSDIPKGTKILIDLADNLIYSKSGKKLNKSIYIAELHEYNNYKSSEEAKTITKSVSSLSKAVTTISLGCGFISNPSSAWALINTIQLISYIPLGSNPLTPKIITFLGSFGQYNFVPNVGYFIFSPNSSSEPYFEARRFGFQSSVFWLNTGSLFSPFFAILALWPLIWVLNKHKIFGMRKIGKILENYKYSFLLRFLLQAYLDIGICAIIQIRAVLYT